MHGNVKRFMVAGDTHGNMAHFQKLFKWAKRHDVDTIVQVGDFGFIWPESARNRWANGKHVPLDPEYDGDRKLHTLNRLAAEAGIRIFWLDGNHEDFNRMYYLHALPSQPREVELASHITYLPRGFVWEWNGVRFMSVGGAFSIDKARRLTGLSWWPEETITSGDFFRAIERVQGKVDVILSHDTVEPPPSGLRRLMGYSEDGTLLSSVGDNGYKTDHDSRKNRQMLTEFVKLFDPALMIHGHYHYAHQSDWVNPETGTNMHVLGLNRDTTGNNSYVIFDTDKFDRDNPNQWS